MFHILLYVVWYAFLIDPASKHTSAIKKNTLFKTKCRMMCQVKVINYRDCVKYRFYQQIRKSIMPQALEPPGLRALPQQKHRLATIIMT